MSPSGYTAPLCRLLCALWSERPVSSTLLLWMTSLVRLEVFTHRIGAFFACLSCFLKVACFLTGLPLAPAAITSSSGNPWVAVLYTWGLAQVSTVSVGVRSCIFRITTCVLSCGLWCACVSVRCVCRPAQCCSKLGDCFLLACLRCGWPGLFGSWVGVGSKFQVIEGSSLLKENIYTFFWYLQLRDYYEKERFTVKVNGVIEIVTSEVRSRELKSCTKMAL